LLGDWFSYIDLLPVSPTIPFCDYFFFSFENKNKERKTM
jgi:hypothetical protein